MISGITFTPAGGSPVTLHALTGKRVVTRAEGLQGATPIREVTTPRGQQSGSYIRSKWFSHRVVTLEGELIGTSIEDSFDEFDSISKALVASVSTAGTLKWTRDAAGQALQLDCQLASLSPLVLTDGANLVSYQVSLVAGDPRVYAQTLTTETGNVITVAGAGNTTAFNNLGSIPSPPKIRVYGGITTPVVKLATGAGFNFTGTIASGDYWEIDVQNRTVKLNGTTSVLANLTAATSDWFEIPTTAGNVTTTASAISGSPRTDLIYRSAWA